MNEYKVLMYPNRYKEKFYNEFVSLFIAADKIEDQVRLRKTEYHYTLNLYNRGLTETLPLYQQARLSEFKAKFGCNPPDVFDKIGGTEVQHYLLDKVHHMVFYKGDFLSVIQMLASFKSGPKRLRSNIASTDDYYEWTEKGGNEKLSHKGNLPKAHFRWNYGGRYLLTDEDVDKIYNFVKPLL